MKRLREVRKSGEDASYDLHFRLAAVMTDVGVFAVGGVTPRESRVQPTC